VSKIHFGIHRQIGRKCYVPLTGRQSDRRNEAGRPAGCEELLRVCPGLRTSG
jgi:hypothetical protein